MKPFDIIIWHDEKFGHHRVWEIEAICLGGEGQEGLVRLRSLTEKPGFDENGIKHKTTLVPEPLLRDMPVYERKGFAP